MSFLVFLVGLILPTLSFIQVAPQDNDGFGGQALLALKDAYGDIDYCDGFYISPFLTDYAVLQRAPYSAKIYGWGTPNTQVSVQLNSESPITTTISINSNSDNDLSSCSWSVSLPVQDTSTLNNTITIQSDIKNYTLNNIKFGDIYYCSGQSNMQFPVQNTFQWYNTSINGTCDNFDINFIRIPDTLSLVPADSRIYNGIVKWYIGNSFNLVNQTFSAVCYYFARHLQTKLFEKENITVPLGLVHSNWGGTIIEAWMSKASQDNCEYRRCNNYDGHAKYGAFLGQMYSNSNNFGCDNTSMTPNNQPASLFNAMVIPWTNYTIKGILWYQGESNGGNPGSVISNRGYSCLLPRMIREWRDYWGYSTDNSYQIGFGIVQISGYCKAQANCFVSRNYSLLYNQNSPRDYYSADSLHPSYSSVAWQRWAQTANQGRVPNAFMPNTWIAMSYDYMDPNEANIDGPPPSYWGQEHPRYKYVVGNRLAMGAMAILYGDNNTPYLGPVFDSCNMDYSNNLLTIVYNEDILRGESVVFNNDLGYGFEIQTTDSLGGWFEINVTSTSENGIKMNLDTSNLLQSNNDYVTGIRYAWRDNPCCKNSYVIYNQNPDLANTSCIATSCSVYSQPSNLPLVPFISSVAKSGACLFESM